MNQNIEIKAPTKDELIKIFNEFDYDHNGVLDVDTELYDLAVSKSKEAGICPKSEEFQQAWEQGKKQLDVAHHDLTQDYFVETVLTANNDHTIDHTITHYTDLVGNL